MKTLFLNSGITATVDDIDYDRIHGFKWKALVDKSVSGQDRWYAYREDGGRLISMHQEVLGVKPGLMIDHRDHNGLNNCRDNLRYVTNRQNQQNRRKNAGCPYKGVRLIPARYEARITVDGKSVYLGKFKTAEEAARAYDTAAQQYFPETACLNFPAGK